jgi:hypothetical protein
MDFKDFIILLLLIALVFEAMVADRNNRNLVHYMKLEWDCGIALDFRNNEVGYCNYQLKDCKEVLNASMETLALAVDKYTNCKRNCS